MRVLLATSPHVRHGSVLQSDFEPRPSHMYTFAPVGLMSVAASVREQRPEIECSLYDLNRRILDGTFPLNESFYRAVAADLCVSSPDFVGFMTECDSYHHLLQIAAEIKRLAPETRIVLGGPHASAVARPTLERCLSIDAIVVGEGERTFPDLLNWYADDDLDAAPTAGAIVRGRSGQITDGGSRPLIPDLDELPLPAYDLYQASAGEEIFLEVGRGCPFQCTFCSTAPYWNRRHRVKSPERLLIEIEELRRRYNVNRCHFTHDLFTTDRRWVSSVCRALIDAGVPVRWTCSARTDTVDPALLELMAQSGCDAIYFGIESGSERILESIRKAIPLEHSLATLTACREAGITPNAGFIVGFPDEDRESFDATLTSYEAALRLGSRPTHLFGFCPFAGASMYSALDSLSCSGHFIDLPLGRRVDEENRCRIAADSTLYGSYFRPGLGASDLDQAVAAADEFSPLVEATLWPALALAEQLGGMAVLFKRWLAWIQNHNGQRLAAGYRRGYGSPLLFATFLKNNLVEVGAPPFAVEAARAVEVNLEVATAATNAPPTTMASYRSVQLPKLAENPPVTLATTVAADRIIALHAFECDVTPALTGKLEDELEPRATRLAWQLTEGGDVRLLSLSETIFDVLETIGERSATVAELMLEGVVGRDVDPDELLGAVSAAAEEGLVRL